jgi:hypothetical protein
MMSERRRGEGVEGGGGAEGGIAGGGDEQPEIDAIQIDYTNNLLKKDERDLESSNRAWTV